MVPPLGGRRLLLAAITAPESIERMLRSMGQAAEAPELAPARAPPGGDAASGASGARRAAVGVAGVIVVGVGFGRSELQLGAPSRPLQDAPHFQITHGILQAPERYWRHLLEGG